MNKEEGGKWDVCGVNTEVATSLRVVGRGEELASPVHGGAHEGVNVRM